MRKFLPNWIPSFFSFYNVLYTYPRECLHTQLPTTPVSIWLIAVNLYTGTYWGSLFTCWSWRSLRARSPWQAYRASWSCGTTLARRALFREGRKEALTGVLSFIHTETWIQQWDAASASPVSKHISGGDCCVMTWYHQLKGSRRSFFNYKPWKGWVLLCMVQSAQFPGERYQLGTRPGATSWPV